jgi:dynein heavy chain
MARDILGKLPKGMDKRRADPKTFETTPEGAMNSLGVFVGQEIDRFSILLSRMKSSLVNLDKAIQGTVVMSMELEMMFNDFLNNKVPAMWAKAGYPSLKPLSSWVPDLLLRLEFISNWLYNGPPMTYWLPAFFFPQGFMTATLQTYARKTATPIDTLAFKTHILDHFEEGVNEPPSDGVNIHGLFFQGAKWDFKKKMVDDSDPKVPIIKMPVIWLEPVIDKDAVDEKAYSCPLYKTSLRAGELSTTGHSTNFVLFLQLPSEVPQDYWIRRGAALLCMTDN